MRYRPVRRESLDKRLGLFAFAGLISFLIVFVIIASQFRSKLDCNQSENTMRAQLCTAFGAR